MKPARILVSIALGLLASASCSSEKDPPAAQAPPAPTPAPTPPAEPPPKAVDPCALLTADEAKALVDARLQEPQKGADYACTWTGDPTGPVGQVEIYLGDNAKKILDIDRDVLKHEMKPVEGVSDEALMEDGAIFVRKGTQWVALRVVRLKDPAGTGEPLVAAARTIASRL
jgi:Protein of unknown function (DUF3558)